MQKKIIALAVAGLMSGVAFAQSNVTVYGVADAYWSRATASGNSTQYNINSSGLSGSRIGFKGVEDLGGGLKALFTLEYGVANDDKSAVIGSGTAPARQQFVGLTGGFGTVVAGSLQTAGYDFACANNPLGGSALDNYHKIGARTLLSCGHDGRASNAFAYISPSFGGLTVAYNHARVSESAGAAPAATGRKDNSANLLAASYANGPIGVNFVYSKISNAATAASDDVKEWGLGGSYDLGAAKIGLQYQTNDNSGIGGKNKKWGLNVAAPVGAGAVVFGYGKSKINETAANDNVKSWTLAYTHSLSKRTTAYGGYNRVSNGSDGSAAALIAPTVGGKSGVWAFGVRHTF